MLLDNVERLHCGYLRASERARGLDDMSDLKFIWEHATSERVRVRELAARAVYVAAWLIDCCWRLLMGGVVACLLVFLDCPLS